MSDTTTPVIPAAPAVKSGYQTTEFWLTVVASTLGLVFASGAVPEAGISGQVLGFAATILTNLGYTVSRTIAKKG
jgi:hypothetical protein